MSEAVSFPKYRKGDLVQFDLKGNSGIVNFTRVVIDDSFHVPGKGRVYAVFGGGILVAEDAVRPMPAVDESSVEAGYTSLDDNLIGERLDPEDIKLSLKDHYQPGQFARILGFTDDDDNYVSFDGMKVYGQICGLAAYDDMVEYYLTVLGKSPSQGVGFFSDMASYDHADLVIVPEEEVRQYEAFMLRGGDISAKPLLKVVG